MRVPDALAIAKELVGRASPSSTSNAAVSDYVAERLRRIGCAVERLEYRDAAGVLKVNVIAKLGHGKGGLSLFAHTDTVPADEWFDGDPYAGTVRADKLYGRGACDMKGPLACMLAAAQRSAEKTLTKPLFLVCTADEEIGYTGAREVVARSECFPQIVQTYGVVGEPTRLQVVHAHKGTALVGVVAHGKAAHSSTAVGLNANLLMIPFLTELKQLHDEIATDRRFHDDAFDPPTPGLNIGLNDHNPVVNVTAPRSVCTIYFRPLPGPNETELLERVRQLAQRHRLECSVVRCNPPMYTDPKSPWVEMVLRIAGQDRPRTVPYGTDGCVFGPHLPLVVCGPGDIAQAHTVDEWIALEQLERGTDFYARLIASVCGV